MEEVFEGVVLFISISAAFYAGTVYAVRKAIK